MGSCVWIKKEISLQKNINLQDLNKFEDSKSKIENSDNISKNGTTIISTQYSKIDYTFETNFLKEINLVRQNPKEFAKKIKNLTNLIIKENNNEYLLYNNEKIKLNKGSNIFYETINYLEQLRPVNKLIFNDNLKVDFENKDILLSKEIIGQIVLNKRLQLIKDYRNCFFCVDVFSDPFLSAVFQITDDNFNQVRRNAILNKDFTMIAINYINDRNNNFISICSLV